MKKNYIFEKVSLVIFSSLFTFLACDFGFSYFYLLSYSPREDHVQRRTFHRPSESLGWEMQPNQSFRHFINNGFDAEYVIDEDGFKKITENVLLPKKTIHFFGDSFTFGYGVSNKNTFPNIIKSKYLNKNVNVKNYGVIAYGIVQMYQSFLEEKKNFKKGDVVIFSPITHDIFRNLDDYEYPYAMLMLNAFKFDKYPYFFKDKVEFKDVSINLFSLFKLLAISSPFTGDVWKKLFDINAQNSLDQLFRIHYLINQECQKIGVVPSFIFIPWVDEINNNRFDFDLSAIQNISILDAFPKKNSHLKLKATDHWNEIGHDLLAEILVKKMIESNLLSKLELKTND